jgi:rod shape-determining protein MreC
MRKIFRRIITDFKEYLLLTILTIISLVVLSRSEKPEAKHLTSFALSNFAVLSEITSSITSIFRTDESVQELQQENAELMLEVNRLRKVNMENEELKSILSFRDTSKYPLLPAKVISKLVTKTQGNFIINQGSVNDIKRGMPVLTSKGLVGLVMDVTENFSVVRTLYNSNLNLAIKVQRSNVDGVLSYDGAKLIIKDIPATYDVQEGDRIETSEFSSLFPPSIPVGQVARKESNVLGLLHNLTVKPFVNIESVNNVFVLKVLLTKQINQLEMNLLK